MDHGGAEIGRAQHRRMGDLAAQAAPDAGWATCVTGSGLSGLGLGAIVSEGQPESRMQV